MCPDLNHLPLVKLINKPSIVHFLCNQHSQEKTAYSVHWTIVNTTSVSHETKVKVFVQIDSGHSQCAASPTATEALHLFGCKRTRTTKMNLACSCRQIAGLGTKQSGAFG